MSSLFKLAKFIVADCDGDAIYPLHGYATRGEAQRHVDELKANSFRSKSSQWKFLRVFAADELTAHISLSRKTEDSL